MLIASKICLPGSPTCIDDLLPTKPGGRPLFETPADILSAALTFIFPIAGLILFANLIWAGFQFLASRGEEKSMEAARGRITSSLLGFILLVVAYWITQAVTRLLSPGGPF